jgi:type I restriction-modification system DNA methylase subunit
MPREQFHYDGSQRLCDLIDEAGQRAGVSRGQAFEDFLACSLAALSRQQMEDEYLAVVRKGYAEGNPGRRGIDALTQAFGTLVDLMEATRRDILGDLFQGGITYGEAGQFITPEEICQLMAALSVDEAPPDAKVFDPCSGSGRMLLAYAEQCRGGELIGQDIDLRCVRMTAINLALRNLYGFALWGNSLSSEVKLAYRTGFNMHGGVIRYAHPDELADKRPSSVAPDPSAPATSVAAPGSQPSGPVTQLHLF